MACDVNSGLLRANAIVLKRRVEELFQAVKAIRDITNPWILDNIDAYLPPVSSVKYQIQAYEGIVIQLLSLSESQKAIKACTDEIPDHKVIPSSTGITIPGDGSFTF